MAAALEPHQDPDTISSIKRTLCAGFLLAVKQRGSRRVFISSPALIAAYLAMRAAPVLHNLVPWLL
jgi:hypothetical protein